MRTNLTRFAAFTLPLFLFAACNDAPPVDAAPAARSASPYAVEEISIGGVKNVHRCGGALLAGQPGEADFALLKEQGIELVLDLRTEGEISFDEPALVEAAGMQYQRTSFREPEELTDEKLDIIRAALNAADETPVIMHCGSANRVGAAWLAWRVLDGGDVSFDEALVDAKTIGLRDDELTARVREYVEARQAEGQ